MSLKEDISKGIASSMKSGDKVRLATLRLLLAAVRSREMEAVKLKKMELGEHLDDAGVQSVAITLTKQRRDSIDQFTKGGRTDLADNEAAEIKVLVDFIPPQLSPEEIKDAVKKAVESTGADSMKDMGKVMKAAMAELKGRADGKDVQAAVAEVLGGGGA